jgi:hypothetical protein
LQLLLEEGLRRRRVHKGHEQRQGQRVRHARVPVRRKDVGLPDAGDVFVFSGQMNRERFRQVNAAFGDVERLRGIRRQVDVEDGARDAGHDVIALDVEGRQRVEHRERELPYERFDRSRAVGGDDARAKASLSPNEISVGGAEIDEHVGRCADDRPGVEHFIHEQRRLIVGRAVRRLDVHGRGTSLTFLRVHANLHDADGLGLIRRGSGSLDVVDGVALPRRGVRGAARAHGEDAGGSI